MLKKKTLYAIFYVIFQRHLWGGICLISCREHITRFMEIITTWLLNVAVPQCLCLSMPTALSGVSFHFGDSVNRLTYWQFWLKKRFQMLGNNHRTPKNETRLLYSFCHHSIKLFSSRGRSVCKNGAYILIVNIQHIKTNEGCFPINPCVELKWGEMSYKASNPRNNGPLCTVCNRMSHSDFTHTHGGDKEWNNAFTSDLSRYSFFCDLS